MKKSTAVGVLVVMLAVLAPMTARANHQGCIVLGEGQGLDTKRECTYVAPTDTQSVYVGTPYDWRVWVLRGEPGNPVVVSLAEGTGPVAGLPPQVHPEIGETVHVSMWVGDLGPLQPTLGFIAAGLEQGHF